MSKDSKNNNIWHNVNNHTKKLLIIDTDQDPFASGGIGTSFKGIENLEPPECVIINIFDYPDIKLDNLKGLPLKMSNLQVFSIIFFNQSKKNLKSLMGLPKELPKLKDFSISSTLMQNLLGLPAQLPSLEHLSIKYIPLESLQYLPKSLPNLESISIHKTNIETLEHFPQNTPVLRKINITKNRLVTLKGLPHKIPKLEKIYISHNQLTSLEHLPYKFQKRKLDYGDKERLKHNLSVDLYKPISFMVDDNPIRTLAGIKFSRFFNILIGIYNTGSLYDIGFFPAFDIKHQGLQLCPTGFKLIKDYHEKKIEVETLELNMSTGKTITHKMVKDPARYDAIVEFYRKTPMELAQQYIENPDSLSDGELERLGWEGGYQERQLLEANLPADHPLLAEISQRLTHQLPSGLSILK